MKCGNHVIPFFSIRGMSKPMLKVSRLRSDDFFIGSFQSKFSRVYFNNVPEVFTNEKTQIAMVKHET